MTAPVQATHPTLLFKKVRVTHRDERVFIAKLLLAAGLTAAGAFLALRPGLLLALSGSVLLGAMYTHMVELQHQCLHHSAFRKTKLHRVIGIPLGIPLLVSYSHYRVRHLQHHRHLGTPRDAEFFGFDARQPLGWGMLIRGLLDYPRILTVGKDIVRSVTGRWSYDLGQISERRRRDIITEYRLMGVVLLAAVELPMLGLADPLWRLWTLPLIIAVPLHFLVELPEHLFCDTETTDVLRNTRSIRGSRFSTWFTNGNNLHVEHHAAMVVPLNRLRERHAETREHAVHVENGYPRFYWRAVKEVNQNARTNRRNAESQRRHVGGKEERQ